MTKRKVFEGGKKPFTVRFSQAELDMVDGMVKRFGAVRPQLIQRDKVLGQFAALAGEFTRADMIRLLVLYGFNALEEMLEDLTTVADGPERATRKGGRR